MDDVDELKELIRLHILTQDVDRKAFEAVLGRIETDGDGPRSWVAQWEREGDWHREAGRLIEAMQCYNFARFPVIDSPARALAHGKCLAAWHAWAAASSVPIERLLVDYDGSQVPIHVSTAAGPARPWLFVVGGIVSLKEQWYRTLADGAKLGFRVAVADFPGVGENPLVYRADSHRLLSAVIDRLHARGHAPVYVVGISFAGHLAIKCAIEDPRVAGIIASGSPLRHFFTDARWWPRVPATTRRTLSHLCHKPPAALWSHVAGFAVDETALQRLAIPICYIASRQDEIVPFAEAALLCAAAPNARVVVFDDVHGAPHHIRSIRKLIPLTLLRMHRSRPAVRAMLWLLLQVARARSCMSRPHASLLLGPSTPSKELQ